LTGWNPDKARPRGASQGGCWAAVVVIVKDQSRGTRGSFRLGWRQHSRSDGKQRDEDTGSHFMLHFQPRSQQGNDPRPDELQTNDSVSRAEQARHATGRQTPITQDTQRVLLCHSWYEERDLGLGFGRPQQHACHARFIFYDGGFLGLVCACDGQSSSTAFGNEIVDCGRSFNFKGRPHGPS
jgi:hypothetical protein